MSGTASTPGVEVRLAAPTDVAAMVAFGRAVVPPHYTPILGASAAQSQFDLWWTPERMAAAAEAGRVHVAIAGGDVTGEQLIGVVETGTYGDDQVIWKLYLAPAVRGRGLGVELLDRAVAALPAGTEHVLVEHFAGNWQAGAFYERGVRRRRYPSHLSLVARTRRSCGGAATALSRQARWRGRPRYPRCLRGNSLSLRPAGIAPSSRRAGGDRAVTGQARCCAVRCFDAACLLSRWRRCAPR